MIHTHTRDETPRQNQPLIRRVDAVIALVAMAFYIFILTW